MSLSGSIRSSGSVVSRSLLAGRFSPIASRHSRQSPFAAHLDLVLQVVPSPDLERLRIRPTPAVDRTIRPLRQRAPQVLRLRLKPNLRRSIRSDDRAAKDALLPLPNARPGAHQRPLLLHLPLPRKKVLHHRRPLHHALNSRPHQQPRHKHPHPPPNSMPCLPRQPVYGRLHNPRHNAPCVRHILQRHQKRRHVNGNNNLRRHPARHLLATRVLRVIVDDHPLLLVRGTAVADDAIEEGLAALPRANAWRDILATTAHTCEQRGEVVGTEGRDGEMERWRDGEMEKWRDGESSRGAQLRRVLAAGYIITERHTASSETRARSATHTPTAWSSGRRKSFTAVTYFSSVSRILRMAFKRPIRSLITVGLMWENLESFLVRARAGGQLSLSTNALICE